MFSWSFFSEKRFQVDNFWTFFAQQLEDSSGRVLWIPPPKHLGTWYSVQIHPCTSRLGCDCRENPISRFISRQKTNRRHKRPLLICIFISGFGVTTNNCRLVECIITRRAFDSEIRSIYGLDQYFRFETTHLFIKQSEFRGQWAEQSTTHRFGIGADTNLSLWENYCSGIVFDFVGNVCWANMASDGSVTS